MSQDENKTDVEENEESETIALEPLTRATGQFYPYFEMYSNIKSIYGPSYYTCWFS